MILDSIYNKSNREFLPSYKKFPRILPIFYHLFANYSTGEFLKMLLNTQIVQQKPNRSGSRHEKDHIRSGIVS